MPARDFLHDAVKNALVKDGWTITHDPYRLSIAERDAFIDLGAERGLTVERIAVEIIAVEIKGFGGASDIRDLEVAVGQYVFYRSLLTRNDPDRKLFLAVPERALSVTLALPIAQPVLNDLSVALLVFDPQQEEIMQWKP